MLGKVTEYKQKHIRIDTKMVEKVNKRLSERHQTFNGYVLSLIDKDIKKADLEKKKKDPNYIQEVELDDSKIEQALENNESLL